MSENPTRPSRRRSSRSSSSASTLLAALLLASTLPVKGQPPESGSPAPPEIAPLEAEVSAEEDRRIEAGLLERMAAIPGLQDPGVEVDAGVVILRGSASTLEAAASAESMAQRVEGVALVDNRIEVVEAPPLERLLPEIFDLRERLRTAIAYLPLVAIALLVMVVALFAARWLRARRQPFERLFQNQFVREIARQIAAGAVAVIGILLALEIVGATSIVAAVLGTAGVVGLAVGFAFRDLAENYIASVLLSLRQPFAPDDLVCINDREGRVLRLTTRATILMTQDGNHLRIPNAEVFKATIINFTRNPTRRFDIAVGVGVDVDLIEAQRLGVEVLKQTAGILDDPAPSAFIEELGDSNVRVRFRAWVDQCEFDFFRVKGEAIRRVKTALEEAGIDMPEPIYRLRVRSDTVAGAPAPSVVEPVPASGIRELPAPVSTVPQAQAAAPAEEVDLRVRDELAGPAAREQADTSENLLDERGPQE